jgi:SAM-dependent methyltransferase
MSEEQAWHEDDAFWETMAPFLFTERRFASAPEQVDRFLDLLALPPGAAILDLCCGPGRHALELARRGFAVTAVDRTAAYLARAREGARREDLDIEFVAEDMRRFTRAGAFDAVINMFTSFGYFEDPADDRRVLENTCLSLKAGGRLLIEMMGKEVLARIFCEHDWWEEDDGTLFLEERHLTEDWGGVRNRWILVREGRREDHTFNHRLYSAAELKALAKACGYPEIAIYGSLAGEKYDQKAGRLVAVACKAG